MSSPVEGTRCKKKTRLDAWLENMQLVSMRKGGRRSYATKKFAYVLRRRLIHHNFADESAALYLVQRTPFEGRVREGPGHACQEAALLVMTIVDKKSV